jgi:putative effector of murein hydrolase
MYEHHSEPLASPEVFAQRLTRNGLIGLALLGFSLMIGMLGYHYLESLSWIDSLLNASMILGGMGPVAPLRTNIGKIFASFYAIYSGVILLASVGILIAPIFHRFLHRFHLADENEDSE